MLLESIERVRFGRASGWHVGAMQQAKRSTACGQYLVEQYTVLHTSNLSARERPRSGAGTCPTGPLEGNAAANLQVPYHCV